MRRFLEFHWLCTKEAWRGCWTRANELASLLGGVVLWVMLWAASPWLRQREMIEAPSTYWGAAGYAVISAIASVILAFAVLFVTRLILAPSRLYWIEKDRADKIASKLKALSDQLAHTLQLTAVVRNDPIVDSPKMLEWQLVVKNASQRPLEYGQITVTDRLDGANAVARNCAGRVLTAGQSAAYCFPFAVPYEGREGVLVVTSLLEYGNVGSSPSRRLDQQMRVDFQPRGIVTHSSCRYERREEIAI